MKYYKPRLATESRLAGRMIVRVELDVPDRQGRDQWSPVIYLDNGARVTFLSLTTGHIRAIYTEHPPSGATVRKQVYQ